MSRLIVCREALAVACAHLAAAYPEEGCGLLVGEDLGTERRVRQAVPVENAAPDRARRYDIAPERFLQEERRARAAGLEVLGIFHSHPGQPPEPSAFDRERAWPYYAYLIAGVEPGRVTEIRCWNLAREGGVFEPQAWHVVEEEAPAQPRRRTES